MSDPNRQTGPILSATEVEERAADWLMERQDQRNWTEDNQRSFDAWLVESLAHQVAFFRLEAALGRTERLRALRPSLRRQNTVWPVILRTAVAFSVIVIAGIAGAEYLLQPGTSTYRTPIGDREILSLGDGSQIELNTDTLLRVAQDAKQRRAWLDKGEAYFQIKHDIRRPFVVEAGQNRVTDLGTKFVMRRFSDRLEVTLVEGSARLNSSENSARRSSAVLKPGDVATVRAGSISVVNKSEQTVADKLGWRRGILTFRYATLAQAAEEFNRYNRTQIVVSDPRIAQVTIYGAFAANDTAAFADVAQAYFKLHVESRDGRIVLSR